MLSHLLYTLSLPHEMSLSSLTAKYYRRPPGLLLTNYCDIHCGGCQQFCGQWRPDQFYEMTLDEVDFYIRLIKKQDYLSHIVIHGGEPQRHRRWREVLALLRSHSDVNFVVFTKYRSEEYANVSYRVDHKTNDSTNFFFPTMIAPIDVGEPRSKIHYYIKALEHCFTQNNNCPTLIYKNKAYFCEVAGGIDMFYNDGKYGWEIKEKPFLRTPLEIINQASQFCYRCGWCLRSDRLNLPIQRPCDPTIVSPTNFSNNYKRMIPFQVMPRFKLV